MGLFDQVLSAAENLSSNQGNQSASLFGSLTEIINSPQIGGVTGLVQAFENGGLGNIVKSWISTGQNLPISPEQIQAILGNEQIQNIASKLGISTDEIPAKLAEYMPQVIDKLTPNGALPSGEQLLTEGIDLLKGKLFS